MTSIIIPIYNTAPYLRQCLDSILSQTIADWEAILVDDGSTDNSGAIADEYAALDDRFRVLHQGNQGQAAARNRGLGVAKGEYMAFVDADDSLESNYLEQLLAHIEDVDVVQAGYQRVTPEGDGLESKVPQHFYQFTSACMRLYRRAFLESRQLRFPEGMYYEDVIFSTRLWQQSPRYRIISSHGYRYTCTPGSTTSHHHERDNHRAIGLLWNMWKQGPRRWVALFTIVRLEIYFIKIKLRT